MPNLNGMKAAQKIYEKDKDVVMVFVTNLEKYAVQGYRVDAMGYLLKPFAYSRFAEIMDKSLRRLERRRAEEIVLLNGGTIVRVPVSNILYIEVIGHILTYHTSYGEYQMRGKLSEKEKELEKMGFARCNKGYLVNLMHVKGIVKNIVQVGEEELLISRGKTKYFAERFFGVPQRL